VVVGLWTVHEYFLMKTNMNRAAAKAAGPSRFRPPRIRPACRFLSADLIASDSTVYYLIT
jgi:hypothetical protein